MRVIVVADGDPPDRAALDRTWPGWADDVHLVVAADGGAVGARQAGLAVDLVVGDGDSLGESGLAALAAHGVAIEISPVDKDESDTELAVLACLSRGATEITIVGAFGGRLDHELANISLLALAALGDRPVQLLDGQTRVRLIRAPTVDGEPGCLDLSGRPGDLVTLLPLADVVDGITTDGLRYPLLGEALRPGPARGLSNVRLGTTASVSVQRGRLLVLESPAEAPESQAPPDAARGAHM
jgi:thiamine pyrophosphokinase